jgi:hypothetical protein
MQGREPVTGKMPVPQVLLLKWKHYITTKAQRAQRREKRDKINPKNP